MSTRQRLIRGPALVVVVVVLLAACGSGSQSPGAKVSKAAAATLAEERLVGDVKLDSDTTAIRAVEVIDPSSGRSVLTGADGSWTIASDRDGTVFIDPRTTPEPTGGRWLLMSATEVQDAAQSMADDMGDLAPLMLLGGLTLNSLALLAAPGQTTLIGREVVSNQATSHFLAEPTVAGVPSAMEVWVSDAGLIVQLRFLASNSLGEPVEVTSTIRPGSSTDRVVFPNRAEAVTTAELEEESRRAEQERQERRAREAAAAAAAEAIASDLVEALELRWLSGEDMYAFVLRDLRQFCLGVDDFVPEGAEIYVTCRPIPSERLLSRFCPAVARFVDTMDRSTNRQEIAARAADMVATVAAESEPAVVTRWRRLSSWEDGVPSTPFELLSEETVDLAIRDLAEEIRDLWTEELELYSDLAVYITFKHVVLGEVCGSSVIVNWDALVPPEQPATGTGTLDASDPLRSALPLRQGSKGSAVAEVQRLLIIAGESLYPDGADGYFGPITATAVSRMQGRNGLAVTGVVDAATLAVLRRIESERQAAPRSSADPPCPSAAEFKQLVYDDVYDPDDGDFSIRDVRCSGPWAAASMIWDNFTDGAAILIKHNATRWSTVGGAWGSENLCEVYSVPREHHAALGC